jgi:hypothetical protein
MTNSFFIQRFKAMLFAFFLLFTCLSSSGYAQIPTAKADGIIPAATTSSDAVSNFSLKDCRGNCAVSCGTANNCCWKIEQTFERVPVCSEDYTIHSNGHCETFERCPIHSERTRIYDMTPDCTHCHPNSSCNKGGSVRF